jgi:excinuclease ABC subunit B
MQRAIDETNRRREKQLAYNAEHGITPETIRKAIRAGIEEEITARRITMEAVGMAEHQLTTQEYLQELETEMLTAAERLEFERAARIRDRILELKGQSGGSQSAKSQSKPRRQRARAANRPGKGWRRK